jgi:hypothetical protein
MSVGVGCLAFGYDIDEQDTLNTFLLPMNADIRECESSSYLAMQKQTQYQNINHLCIYLSSHHARNQALFSLKNQKERAKLGR